MRVLFVSSGLDPATGGTATAAVMVALAAARAGVEATLVHPVEPSRATQIAPAEERLRAAGIEVRSFPFATVGGARAVAWGVAPALDRWVRANVARFDVVHAHSPWVLTSLRAMGAAEAAGKPFVLMPHEGFTRFDMERAASPLLVRAKSVLRARYRRGASRILVSSPLELRDSLLDGDPKSTVLYHPAFDEQDPPPVNSRRGEAQLTVGFLGRFHPKKNLPLLIDALARVPEARLVIGGDGPERAQIETRAEAKGVRDRVEFLGFLDQAGKTRFFTDVDLVAMPSRFECFGLVAAEAMAYGTPVLVSPTVGIAEIVADHDAGLVIPPRGDALAEGLRKALVVERRLGWGGHARQAAFAHFSLGAHGAALAALYQELGPHATGQAYAPLAEI